MTTIKPAVLLCAALLLAGFWLLAWFWRRAPRQRVE